MLKGFLAVLYGSVVVLAVANDWPTIMQLVQHPSFF